MSATNFTASLAPAATTETDLYTVPGGSSAIVSSLVVCNRSASPARFRISATPGGGGTANKDYLYYDVEITGNNTFIATVGLTPLASQVFRVYASTANLSFSMWGSLIT